MPLVDKQNIFNNNYFEIFLSFLIGFAIPVSIALQNITIAILCIFVVFNKSLRNKIKYSFNNYFVIFCFVLYCMIILRIIHTNANQHDIIRMLIKMLIFGLCPLIFTYFSTLNNRVNFAYGFIYGAMLSLIASIMMFLFHKPLFYASSYLGSSGDWAAFNYHTYHIFFLGLLMVGIISFLLYFKQHIAINMKRLLFIIILLIMLDNFYLVQGRAGQIITIVMLAIVLLSWNIRKGFIYCVLIGTIIPFVFYSSPAINSDLLRLRTDVANYNAGNPVTSVGLRLEFYKYSKIIIKSAPILGYGTGSFRKTYQQFSHFTEGVRATNNPHNDFYWLWIELGVFGVLNLILIIISGLYYAFKQNSLESKIAVAVIISYIIGALQGGFFTDAVTSSAFIILICVLISGSTFNKFIKLNG